MIGIHRCGTSVRSCKGSQGRRATCSFLLYLLTTTEAWKVSYHHRTLFHGAVYVLGLIRGGRLGINSSPNKKLVRDHCGNIPTEWLWKATYMSMHVLFILRTASAFQKCNFEFRQVTHAVRHSRHERDYEVLSLFFSLSAGGEVCGPGEMYKHLSAVHVIPAHTENMSFAHVTCFHHVSSTVEASHCLLLCWCLHVFFVFLMRKFRI